MSTASSLKRWQSSTLIGSAIGDCITVRAPRTQRGRRLSTRPQRVLSVLAYAGPASRACCGPPAGQTAAPASLTRRGPSRMIGGVLTERTVGTVLPAVKENMGKLKVLFASMVLRVWT